MTSPQLLKLPLRLRRDYDQKILDLMRRWEKTERKVARQRNHLHYTLHCKHHRVFPPSLVIKTSMKGANAEKIIKKAQIALINERIRHIYHTLDLLANQILEFDEFLFTSLPGETYDEIKEWVAHARRAEWDTCRTRHRKKFDILKKKQTVSKKCDDRETIIPLQGGECDDLKTRWVINLSNHPLKQSETTLLQHGLNFAVAPASIPMLDMIIGVETACKYLGPNSVESSTLRADCVRLLTNAKPPPSNISKGEREALRELSKNKSIIILPADKGRATVLLNREDYKTKLLDLLKDTKTYKRLKKDPTSSYSNKLIAVLQSIKDSGNMDQPTYRRLYPTAADPPQVLWTPQSP